VRRSSFKFLKVVPNIYFNNHSQIVTYANWADGYLFPYVEEFLYDRTD